VDVRLLPGLEHLPFAEVWLDRPDEELLSQASAAARALGKDGLEVWTTDRTSEVAGFLEARGFVKVRGYVISELDVAAAAQPEPPKLPLVTLANRPDLEPDLYAVACESYPDQPGRAETVLPGIDSWRSWGLDADHPDACFIALENGTVLGYGYLDVEGDTATHGSTAVARTARGRGVAGSIKRAQIGWAKRNGIRSLRTATELRLAQMRGINERLGYVPLYEEIVLRGPATSPDLELEPN
jgi:GNAT superfamily N-acetyltransferase